MLNKEIIGYSRRSSGAARISKVVSPKEYLKLIKSESSYRIKGSKILPPKLGSNSFGEILVEL